MPRDGAARSGRVGGRAFVVVGLAAALFAPWSAFAEDVQPKVSPDRIDDVPSTKQDPYPAFDNFAWRAFVALGVAGADGPGPSRRARPHEDAGRPRSPRVGDLQVALRSLSARAGRPRAGARRNGPATTERTLAAPAPTIEPRRSPRSLPSPTSIRRVSRRANSSARWLRRMAPICATRCGSTRPSSN